MELGILEWLALGLGCTKISAWMVSRRSLEVVVMAYYVCRYYKAVLQTLMLSSNTMVQFERTTLPMSYSTENTIDNNRKIVIFNLLLNFLLIQINM
jgi:hypothetical protein